MIRFLLLFLFSSLAFAGSDTPDINGIDGDDLGAVEFSGAGGGGAGSSGNCSGAETGFQAGDLSTAITFTQNNSYQDPVDVNANIEENDLIIFHVVNNHATLDRDFGVRPNASGSHSDDFSADIQENSGMMVAVTAGINGDVEITAEDSNIAVYYVGRLPASQWIEVQNATTQATAIDETGFSGSAWNTETLGAGGTRKAAILVMTSLNINRDGGARHPSRATNHQENAGPVNYMIANMHTDTQLEMYHHVNTTDQEYYILGYLNEGYTPYENATTDMRDDSLGTTGTPYTNFTAIGNNNTGVWWRKSSANTQTAYIRTEGDTDAYQLQGQERTNTFIVTADSSGIVEGIISALGTDFFLVGQFDAYVAGSGLLNLVGGNLNEASIACGGLVQ